MERNETVIRIYCMMKKIYFQYNEKGGLRKMCIIKCTKLQHYTIMIDVFSQSTYEYLRYSLVLPVPLLFGRFS